MIAILLMALVIVALWPVFFPIMLLLILIACGIVGYIAWFIWTM